MVGRHTIALPGAGRSESNRPTGKTSARILSLSNGEKLIIETRDTRVLVEKSSGACHKSFATEKQAIAFLEAGIATLKLQTTLSL